LAAHLSSCVRFTGRSSSVAGARENGVQPDGGRRCHGTRACERWLITPGRRGVPVRPLTGCRFDAGWGKRAGLRGEVWASDNSDSRERFFR
jgi:hypothetical protein